MSALVAEDGSAAGLVAVLSPAAVLESSVPADSFARAVGDWVFGVLA